MDLNGKKHTFGMTLCMSVSVLVLTSCMPDDEGKDKQASTAHNEAQVAQYAQSFQQYSSRSMNAVVNSDLWKAQTLPEGVLTLSNSTLGSLDLGGAEAYMESAYCVVAGTPKHLTWFEGEEDNKLFLQGLGVDAAGMTASKLRGMIAKENFGIARGGSIEMADGTNVSPSGNCNALNIPKGSVVAIVPLPEPVSVAQVQEKFVMRAVNCPAGTEGNVMQRVMATYMPSGNIVVGGSSFTSEAGIMADNGLSWDEVASNCLAPEERIARNVSDASVNALDMANLITIPGDIKVALENNLQNVECKGVVGGDEIFDEDGNAVEELYNTCAGPVTIDPLTGIEIGPDTLVRTEEETVMATCGGQPAGSSTVTINTNDSQYNGIPSYLNGRSVDFSKSTFTGDSAYKKITRFYAIVEDFKESEETLETEVVTYEGLDLQCERNETIDVACSVNNYEENENTVSVNIVAQKDGQYQRQLKIEGWSDAQALQPNDPIQSSWYEVNPYQCDYEIVEKFDYCEDGQTTTKTGKKNKTVSTEQLDSEWQTSRENSCLKEEVISTFVRCNTHRRENNLNISATKTILKTYSHYTHDGVVRVDEPFLSTVAMSTRGMNRSDCDTHTSSSCFVFETPIAMEDGTYKSIGTLQVSDKTLFGTVNQTFIRAYNAVDAITENGLATYDGGIFDYRGIQVTGNHMVNSHHVWGKVSDHWQAKPIDDSHVKNVYNLDIEGGIIPVIDKNGSIIEFSDEKQAVMTTYMTKVA